MKNAPVYRWKFLREVDGKIKSNSGDCTWTKNRWKYRKDVQLCEVGFHCSKEVYQAFTYVQGEILALVECDGLHQEEQTKEVWQKMRIVKTYKWQKKDSVALAIFAAEQVIDIFEKYESKDDRPRKAIEAARKYLQDPSEENKNAARAARAAADAARAAACAACAARAACAAYAAADAARAAAYAAADAARAAAYAAADAADAAARAAADAARAAADAADAAACAAYAARAACAAYAAADAALIERIANWMNERVKELEEN